MVFEAWSARIFSACEFTPGMGMVLPARYTPSIASVNSTRLRRSVIWNRFLSALSIATPLRLCLQHLGRAAGRGQLLRRLAAELVRLDAQLLRHVAARQH